MGKPVVLITGALTGIGRSTAMAFAENGARLVVSGRRPTEASTGVRVNAVAPGPTDTGMLDRFTGTPEKKAALIAGVPIGRIGKPDDIANGVLFLATDASSFVTGQILTVDGGKTAG
jgi:NAD(P)-dependent dehydrogenase (short-subunit alcohol dehydrogenase family)